MNEPVETSGQDAMNDQPRPANGENAPALESQPPTVGRASGLTFGDVCDGIDAAIEAFAPNDKPGAGTGHWFNRALYDAEYSGQCKCLLWLRDWVTERIQSQSV